MPIIEAIGHDRIQAIVESERFLEHLYKGLDLAKDLRAAKPADQKVGTLFSVYGTTMKNPYPRTAQSGDVEISISETGEEGPDGQLFKMMRPVYSVVHNITPKVPALPNPFVTKGWKDASIEMPDAKIHPQGLGDADISENTYRVRDEDVMHRLGTKLVTVFMGDHRPAPYLVDKGAEWNVQTVSNPVIMHAEKVGDERISVFAYQFHPSNFKDEFDLVDLHEYKRLDLDGRFKFYHPALNRLRSGLVSCRMSFKPDDGWSGDEELREKGFTVLVYENLTGYGPPDWRKPEPVPFLGPSE